MAKVKIAVFGFVIFLTLGALLAIEFDKTDSEDKSKSVLMWSFIGSFIVAGLGLAYFIYSLYG
jgi:hypothetical protein